MCKKANKKGGRKVVELKSSKKHGICRVSCSVSVLFKSLANRSESLVRCTSSWSALASLCAVASSFASSSSRSMCLIPLRMPAPLPVPPHGCLKSPPSSDHSTNQATNTLHMFLSDVYMNRISAMFSKWQDHNQKLLSPEAQPQKLRSSYSAQQLDSNQHTGLERRASKQMEHS